MPHFGHDIPQNLLKMITKAVRTVLLIVLFYILQYIFDIEFVCSCKAGLHLNGVVYILVPPLIFTMVIKITEPFREKKIFPSWRIHNCSRNNLCSYVLRLVISYIGLSAVWISIVLFDGDWYVCLLTNLNNDYTGIPCRTNLTYEEQRIKDGYKTDSLDIGFAVISAFLFFWNIFVLCGNCCMKNNWFRRRPNLCLPYYKVLYYDHLKKEVKTYLNNRIKNIAAQRAEAICEPHLQAIERHELSAGNTNDGQGETDETVSETWWTISGSEFHLTEIPVTQQSQIG